MSEQGNRSPVAGRRVLLSLVDGGAAAVAPLLRAAGALARPFVRFWRLATLKSRVDGHVPATTQFDGPLRAGDRVRLELGDRCRLGGDVFLETCEQGVIRIGDDVRINAGVFIVAYAEVSIGRDAMIGEYVSIRDANHGVDPDRLVREQPHSAAPIRIGEGAWIGRGVVVLKGVSIGAGAVVAANSVVTRDIPPMVIAAGAPARALRSRDAAPAGAKGDDADRRAGGR